MPIFPITEEEENEGWYGVQNGIRLETQVHGYIITILHLKADCNKVASEDYVL